MKPSDSLFRRLPVLTAIAFAFPLVPAVSFAQSTFSASGSYVVGGDTANGLSKPKSGSFTIPTTAGAVQQSAVGGMGGWDSAVSVSAAASGDGHFGAAVMTQESYGSRSPMQTQVSMTYGDAIVNTSGTAQAASFTLNISSLQFAFDYGTRSGLNAASFSASVFVDGSNAAVWSTSFAYDSGWPAGTYSGGGTYTSSGQDIGLAAQLPSSCVGGGDAYGCIFSNGGFGISNYQTTIALGTVASGASIGIRYVVDIGTETNMYGGNAAVTFNDPSNLAIGGAAAALRFDAATGPTVSAVPEPETYLLMAAGLGLLGAGVRRRRAR